MATVTEELFDLTDSARHAIQDAADETLGSATEDDDVIRAGWLEAIATDGRVTQQTWEDLVDMGLLVD